MQTFTSSAHRQLSWFARSGGQFVVLLAAGFLCSALVAQDTPTFSSDVKVVNVLATVRDKHGQIVNNLTKDDFKLQQDGQPQSIRYFTKETDLPLSLGLLVDTSMSQRRVLEQERTASYSFLNNLMRPDDKDKAFVIHFDWDIELLQDLTSSRPKLEAALDKLDNPRFAPGYGGGGGAVEEEDIPEVAVAAAVAAAADTRRRGYHIV